MKQAVIYQPDENKVPLLYALMTSLGIQVRRAEEKDLDKTIAELFGLPAFFGTPDQENEALQAIPAVTVLCGFQETELDAFLAAKRAAGIGNTGFLSIVTPMNLGWTLKKLALELQREHEEIEKQVCGGQNP